MPHDMGSFRVDVELENPARPGQRRTVTSVLVDTGLLKSSLRWGSGLGAPTREGTPKHATGTCACPSLLRASECRFRGALACKAPSAPTPSVTYRVVRRSPNARDSQPEPMPEYRRSHLTHGRGRGPHSTWKPSARPRRNWNIAISGVAAGRLRRTIV